MKPRASQLTAHSIPLGNFQMADVPEIDLIGERWGPSHQMTLM